METNGTVYLLHFERPYSGRSQHFLSFTSKDLQQQLERHRRGTACQTTKVAFKQGITFTLAGTWSGTSGLRNKIKSRGVISQCSACQARTAASLPRPT